ncbi:calcium-binding protein [Kineosporia babensis]|uniref:Calcium-binding protein n=1 Tax=Kineosporia babensis TaxID=499548 RepID=A0A9X1NG57_9ACTN|nr:hypothetical protein [Kineosporia babensis]MCD5313320.1 hypothetical protein [Kineosporia babensis]
MRFVLRPVSALALVTAGSLIAAGPAPAGPPSGQALVGIQNLRLIYTAAPGHDNRLTVTMQPAEGAFYEYLLEDNHAMNAVEGCDYPTPGDLTKVSCLVEMFDSRDPAVLGQFRLGDGDDTVRFVNTTEQAYYANEFWLGTGNDKATTRQADGSLDGSGIWGQNGRDVITAGRIGDLGGVWGGNHDDTISIGPGGYNSAHGGNGNDKLQALDGVLYGDDGNDLLDGGPTADSLYGGPGNDRIHGRAGADRIYGNSGNDKLYGGRGTDFISGGPGRDHIEHD